MIMDEAKFHEYTESESKGVPVLLSTRQLAELSGISAPALVLWRSQGIGLPFVRVGGRVFYRFQEVLRYMQEGEAEPPEEFPSVF